MIFLEILDDGGMHIAELAAVTFIEDNDHTLLIHIVTGIFLYEGSKLLNGGNDDPGIRVFKLLLQNRSRGVAVGGTFFKAVIFLHRLVVQVFPVDHEQHLVDVRQLRCKP